MDLLDGLEGLELPSRGWSMKRGHRKRLEPGRPKAGKARDKEAPCQEQAFSWEGRCYCSRECLLRALYNCILCQCFHLSSQVGLGRSVAKRSIHSGSRHHEQDDTYRGKYGVDYLPVTRRNNLRRCMHEALRELEDTEADGACFSEEGDASVLSLEDWKEAEVLKWDDLEVTSICTCTTADPDSASSISELPSCSSLDACREAASFASKASVALGLSPWQAALLRAKRHAKEWLAETLAEAAEASKAAEARKKDQPEQTPKSKDEQFLEELGHTHRVRVQYDVASLADTASPFEKFRWQFLRDFGHEICRPLSECYQTSWNLKPAPLDKTVQQMFLDACRCAKKGELQPALHGTNQANLSSIYARGLLIPGKENQVRIANGSVHGVGIYTAYVQYASMSLSYARGSLRPILVCGVLDPNRGAITPGKQRSNDVCYTGGARIFFKENMVAPLFEATAPAHVDPGAVVLPPVLPVKRGRTRPVLLPDKKRKGPGPRTRLRRAAPPLRSALAFLARRAARKRQT